MSLLKFLVLATTAAGSALVLSLFVEPVPSTVHAAPESTAVDGPGAAAASAAERTPSAPADATLGARLADQLVRYVGRERSVAALRWLDDELPRRDS